MEKDSSGKSPIIYMTWDSHDFGEPFGWPDSATGKLTMNRAMHMTLAWCQWRNPGEMGAFASRAILSPTITSGTRGRGAACFLLEHQGDVSQIRPYRCPVSPNSSLEKTGHSLHRKLAMPVQPIYVLFVKKATLPFRRRRRRQGSAHLSMLENPLEINW